MMTKGGVVDVVVVRLNVINGVRARAVIAGAGAGAIVEKRTAKNVSALVGKKQVIILTMKR